MIKRELIKGLEKVENLALASKFSRFQQHPFKYLYAILFRELIYKKTKRAKEISCKTFFNAAMHILLPSSTDIYLTGGKSHDSEIRLARFLIRNLEKSDCFIDIGAHYGYYTLLGSKLVGDNGTVYSFEASPTTFEVLLKNTYNKTNISSFNLAVSDKASELKFYEFSNLFSEYNTLDIDQFRSEPWFTEHKPKEINIRSVILDDFLSKENVHPKIFKIDVEGAENQVINGLRNYLKENAPRLVMEYLSKERGNEEHQEAARRLKSWGYLSFVIDSLGNLRQLDSISEYLEESKLESDNIVFVKKGKE